MRIARKLKNFRNRILKRFNPLGYAKKVGVNFPWGGYTYMAISNGILSLG